MYFSRVSIESNYEIFFPLYFKGPEVLLIASGDFEHAAENDWNMRCVSVGKDVDSNLGQKIP